MYGHSHFNPFMLAAAKSSLDQIVQVKAYLGNNLQGERYYNYQQLLQIIDPDDNYLNS